MGKCMVFFTDLFLFLTNRELFPIFYHSWNLIIYFHYLSKLFISIMYLIIRVIRDILVGDQKYPQKKYTHRIIAHKH